VPSLFSCPNSTQQPSPKTRKALPETHFLEKSAFSPESGQLVFWKNLRFSRNPVSSPGLGPRTRNPDPASFGTRKPRFWNACSHQTQRDCQVASNYDGGGREPGTRGIDPGNRLDPGNRPRLTRRVIHSLLTTCGFCCIIDLVTIRQVPIGKGVCL
jgi:hypothetical protein